MLTTYQDICTVDDSGALIMSERGLRTTLPIPEGGLAALEKEYDKAREERGAQGGRFAIDLDGEEYIHHEGPVYCGPQGQLIHRSRLPL